MIERGSTHSVTCPFGTRTRDRSHEVTFYYSADARVRPLGRQTPAQAVRLDGAATATFTMASLRSASYGGGTRKGGSISRPQVDGEEPKEGFGRGLAKSSMCTQEQTYSFAAAAASCFRDHTSISNVMSSRMALVFRIGTARFPL